MHIRPIFLMICAYIQQPLRHGVYTNSTPSHSVVMPIIHMWLQDEVYHIRQTQRFCAGSFEYDPMITTLPGVYIVGVLWSQTLRLTSWVPALLYSTPPLPVVWHRTASLIIEDIARIYCQHNRTRLKNAHDLPNSL